MKKVLAVLVVQLSIGAGVALADGGPSMEALRGCVAQEDAARRLSCYDRAMGRETQDAVPQSANLSAPPASVPANDASKFGYRGAIAREEMDRRKEEGLDQVSGVVTEVGRLPLGQYVVTLDNGQVWEQLRSNSRLSIDVGDSVTIKGAALGSFMLVTQSGIGTKVTRKR